MLSPATVCSLKLPARSTGWNEMFVRIPLHAF
jgi:hypothetical protein